MKPGDRIAGRYGILWQIGQGATASVWAAHDEVGGGEVAVKVGDDWIAERLDMRERFAIEGRAVKRLKHPNIVEMMDCGELPDGRPYIVFELLHGFSLEEHMDGIHPLSTDEAVRIAIEICRGLGAAHARAIMHRDLTPGNVFLHAKPSGDKEVKLLDFGFSSVTGSDTVRLFATAAGVALGTPHYMSAEQARGLDDIDPRTDLWSVGVILYEAVSATLPFDASNYNTVLDRIAREPPTPLSPDLRLPVPLVTIIDRCLAKSPADRFQSAGELGALLERLLPDLPATTSAIAARRKLRSLPDLGG